LPAGAGERADRVSLRVRERLGLGMERTAAGSGIFIRLPAAAVAGRFSDEQ